MSFGEIPSSHESPSPSAQVLLERLMPSFETVETQEQAIDAILELKMQCVENGVDFNEATMLTAGLAETARSVGIGLIRGVLTNPQGLTAVGQLLS